MDTNYTMKRGSIADLDKIKPLWEQLNHLHHEVSPYFKERFEKMTWEKRKAMLLEKSGEIILDYVVENTRKIIIAYCISSIEKADPKTGEIDSILIDNKHRKAGLGKKLMDRAIQWLISKGVENKILMVCVGNESVMEFYKQYGFYPLHIVLQKKDN